jgi:hypothetical protein
MREFETLFKRTNNTLDKKRFRKPFGIKGNVIPARYEEFKNAIDTGIRDVIKEEIRIEDVKDEINVVRNYIENSKFKEEDKEYLNILNGSVNDAFMEYRKAKIGWGDVSNAIKNFRDTAKRYFESADQMAYLERARQGFEKFKDAYGAGDHKWKRFLIEIEDGGLQAMFLGLKPGMLTEKGDFPNEYIGKLKEHSGGDIDIMDIEDDYLVFSKSNVKRIFLKYQEYFPGYSPDLEVSSYLSNLVEPQKSEEKSLVFSKSNAKKIFTKYREHLPGYTPGLEVSAYFSNIDFSQAPEEIDRKKDYKLQDIPQGLLFGYEPHSVEQFATYNDLRVALWAIHKGSYDKFREIEQRRSITNLEDSKDMLDQRNDIILAKYFCSGDSAFQDKHKDKVSEILANWKPQYRPSKEARDYVVAQRSIHLDGLGFQYIGDPTSEGNIHFVKMVTDIFDQSGMSNFVKTENTQNISD